MGAEQSIPSASSPSSRRHSGSSDSSHSAHSAQSAHSAHSPPAAPSLTRSDAVRHHTPPAPACGSHREYLMLREQLLQMAYNEPINADSDIFGDNHGYAARFSSPVSVCPYNHYSNSKSYIPISACTCDYSTGGPSPFPPRLSRTRALRSSASPSARPGSRRDMMLRDANPISDPPVYLPDDFYSEATPSSPSVAPPSPTFLPPFMVSFDDIVDMGYPVPIDPSPALQYLVKPKTPNSRPVKSRFREEF
ncbi:hypothetical protein HMPREF1624_00804 [Sporothrix schenckii ATCC 58251]|uniref:Uncharacterized protein n=1 Tax=Sporothrix schenckii (strain ATCC 58251 / de Perez 2211183) TaxID=1391915 RepID=U7Q671_SPOS1|nr:hypothetical protein HMPREF1624_00804 [Sporothrix schenckii ATCC 58251]